MSGAVIGVLFATVVVISAVTVGIAAPSGTSGEATSQEQVDTVANGMRSSLADVNQPSSSATTGVKSKMESIDWERLPAAVQTKLQEHVGSYVAQTEALGRQSGHVTRIEPAGSGVTTGLLLHQKPTGSKTVRKKVTETYTETVTRTETRQVGTKTKTKRVLVDRKTRTVKRKVFDHFEMVPSGETKTVTFTTQETYKVPIYRTETRTIEKRVRRTEEVPVYDTYQVLYQTEQCYSRAANSSPYEYSKESKTFEIVRGSYAHCMTWTETKREVTGYAMVTNYEWVTVTEEFKVFDHYENRTRTVHVSKDVPIYEKQPVYKTVTEKVGVPVYKDVTKTIPIYDEVTVTEEVTKTRTVTKNVSVSGTPFTYESKSDWTLAYDVADTRQATMTVRRGSLATSKRNAMTLRAVDQSGDIWRMHVWRSGETVIVETSTGLHHEVDAANVTLDLTRGTIGGDATGLRLADGLDDPYDLQFRNGDKAKGTYEFVVDGTSAVTSKGGLQVKDDIIYKAVFDITYSTQDTTYTDRITITPDVGEASS